MGAQLTQRLQLVLYFFCNFRYGEIVNINLVRDRKSGKSKGYCFLAYEDQRSTVLAVDNFNGIRVCGVIIIAKILYECGPMYTNFVTTHLMCFSDSG